MFKIMLFSTQLFLDCSELSSLYFFVNMLIFGVRVKSTNNLTYRYTLRCGRRKPAPRNACEQGVIWVRSMLSKSLAVLIYRENLMTPDEKIVALNLVLPEPLKLPPNVNLPFSWIFGLDRRCFRRRLWRPLSFRWGISRVAFWCAG